MLQLNQDLMQPYMELGSESLRPDGDVVLNEDVYRRFIAPSCSQCLGTLKPDVTFFGDVVPQDVVQSSYGVVDQHDAFLVRVEANGGCCRVWK
eukprot:m.154200 g.154200  ORF g.154200 m.154200 type:complete len:93 (-) comp16382_c0_seq12:1612-1890(-)